MISKHSQMKKRFATFLHSKFGLISSMSTHPLLTFASSSGLKFVIWVIIFCCHSEHSTVLGSSEASPVFSGVSRKESKNFSSFLVISFGVILILNFHCFLVIYSASQALQLKIAGPDNHRWVNKIFH